MRNLLLIFPSPARENQLKFDFQRVRRRANLCGQRPLMKTNLRIGFQFCPCRLSPEQSGGLETLLRRRTKGSFKKGTENQRMGNPWFLTLWEPVFLPHPGYCVPPIGWESMNSAQRERVVRRSLLCWHYGFAARVLGQLRIKYRFCIAQALRAAVRPAFAVLICAPGLGSSVFRVCLLL